MVVMMMLMAMLVGAWAGWLDRVTMQRLSMRRSPRCPGVQRCPGALVSWCPDALVSRGALVPWCPGVLVSSCTGVLVPWCPGEQYASRRASHFKLCTLSNMPLTMLLRCKASHFKPLPAPRSIAIWKAHLLYSHLLHRQPFPHWAPALFTMHYATCTMHCVVCKLQELSERHCTGRQASHRHQDLHSTLLSLTLHQYAPRWEQ